MRSSRDVALDDIDTISRDMTSCIRNNLIQRRPCLAITPPSTPVNTSILNEKESPNLKINIPDKDIHVDDTYLSNEEKKTLYNFKSPRYQETSDNSNRKELLWTSNIEDVIKNWYNNCLKFAKTHDVYSKYYKKIFYALSIPSTIIPLVVAALGDTLVDEYKIIATSLLIKK